MYEFIFAALAFAVLFKISSDYSNVSDVLKKGNFSPSSTHDPRNYYTQETFVEGTPSFAVNPI